MFFHYHPISQGPIGTVPPSPDAWLHQGPSVLHGPEDHGIDRHSTVQVPRPRFALRQAAPDGGGALQAEALRGFRGARRTEFLPWFGNLIVRSGRNGPWSMVDVRLPESLDRITEQVKNMEESSQGGGKYRNIPEQS